MERSLRTRQMERENFFRFAHKKKKVCIKGGCLKVDVSMI